MHYSKITYPDLNNGTGCRVSLWVCGCSIQCKHCFNSELWNFNSGRVFDDSAKESLFNILKEDYISGLSLLGGEPTDQGKELIELLKDIKTQFPEKDIWMWTGKVLQDLIDEGNTGLFKYVDYIVDGPFIEKQSGTNLKFKGSKNQIIWKKVDNVWTIYD